MSKISRGKPRASIQREGEGREAGELKEEMERGREGRGAWGGKERDGIIGGKESIPQIKFYDYNIV
jgi:hypothetical protein